VSYQVTKESFISNQNSSAPQVVVIASQKSPVTAAVLGFFFGPLGLLYSTAIGAIVAFVIAIPLSILRLGFGYLLVALTCAVVGYLAAAKHNKKSLQSAIPSIQTNQQESERSNIRAA